MKLDHFVPFGYTYYTVDDRFGCFLSLNTGTAIPKTSRKQSNGLIVLTKNRLSQFKNI